VGFVPGSFLFLPTTQAPPPGFTLFGRTTMLVQIGRGTQLVTFAIYRKN